MGASCSQVEAESENITNTALITKNKFVPDLVLEAILVNCTFDTFLEFAQYGSSRVKNTIQQLKNRKIRLRRLVETFEISGTEVMILFKNKTDFMIIKSKEKERLKFVTLLTCNCLQIMTPNAVFLQEFILPVAERFCEKITEVDFSDVGGDNFGCLAKIIEQCHQMKLFKFGGNESSFEMILPHIPSKAVSENGADRFHLVLRKLFLPNRDMIDLLIEKVANWKLRIDIRPYSSYDARDFNTIIDRLIYLCRKRSFFTEVHIDFMLRSRQEFKTTLVNAFPNLQENEVASLYHFHNNKNALIRIFIAIF